MPPPTAPVAMTSKRPTITDVARHAGVSKATVSAVLNAAAGVKASTRDRVNAAIELLNYRPSQVAGRAAAVRKHKSIALVIKEHDNPFYAEIIAGMRACTEARGYPLLVVSSEGDHELERQVVELLRGKDVDGIVLTPTLHGDADFSHFFELKRRNLPFVLLEEVRGVPASVVDIDNAEASRRAVEHLFALGHTRIVHLAGPAYSSHSQERIDGVLRAFSSSHIAVAADGIVTAGAHLADGYRAGLELFRSRDAASRPTAVTCYNDLVAVGLYRALAELGLRVPDDVSVIGFDDIPLCDYLPVPLTTVRMPTHRMGELAAQMLVRHIESKTTIPPQRVYLEATLVIRASTAPPRATGPAAAAAPGGALPAARDRAPA
jgi:LacI family transcriptional regulator